MRRKGTTLIETAIAIFIVAAVLMTFLESLNTAITGTLQLNRKTSALNLVKSEIEYVKAQQYNASAGDLEDVYWPLITTGGCVSDIINYNMSGQVSNISVNQSLQLITVNVSYLTGKQVEISAYKTSDGSDIEPEPRGLLVTDNIIDAPLLPQGYSFLCAGQFKGFYHVFTTGTEGAISMSWTFNWSRVSPTSSMGAPMMAIYAPNASTGEPPNWVIRNYEDEVREDGIITRRQNKGIAWLPGVIGIGDLPGPGEGGTGSMCYCCDSTEISYDDCAGEYDPIAYAPHAAYNFFTWLACLAGGYTGPYPCCGAQTDQDSTGSSFWIYDSDTGDMSGTISFCLTTDDDVEVGTYTVLFFNGENNMNLDTISASVSYWK